MGAFGGPVVDVRDVSRSYGRKRALDGVSLSVGGGRIHALLGRNGAGKTTLLRLLSGLVTPSAGVAIVAGIDAAGAPRTLRRAVGLVPSGDRSFYLRISGYENLVFFGRLLGLRKCEARSRARHALEQVGLGEAARVRVGEYSHGMQKRLGVARALLARPRVLLVDEATHDLDPEAARTVRELVRGAADGGAAVVWATQRIEEIKGFADAVTVLDGGRVQFDGSVSGLLAFAAPRRYVLELRNGTAPGDVLEQRLRRELGTLAAISYRPNASLDTFVLSLESGAVLGEALSRLLSADTTVLSCRQEFTDVEEAFLTLVGETP